MTNRDDKLPPSGDDKSENGDRFEETFDSNSVPAGDSEETRSFEASTGATKNIGPYKLLQKLGEGGMGTVWLAEQQKPVRRRVALKLIRTGIDNKQVIARFEAERQVLAMMNHENIAKILDAGTTDTGQPYFVMELVQGVPFNKYCENKKLSIKDRLGLFIPVCKAVQHAHQKGIIHRDLKPSNVLVCLYDGVPVPKVIDFGLAKALEPTTHLTDKTMFTEFGQVVGTLQYMSPEQAEMDQLDIDTRTDIYSLGVMLYELLTGNTPIDQETLKGAAILKVLEVIREKEPPRPSARLSSSTNEAVSEISSQRQIESNKLKNILRGELDWIVMKSIEKDRVRRYETASSFADDIQRFLADEAVEARPASRTYRIGKFFNRNRGLAAALTTITVLLIVGVGTSTWFGVNAGRQKDRADKLFVNSNAMANDYFTTVSENVLLNQPGMTPLRVQLLRKGEIYYRNLAKEEQDDPQVAAAVAVAKYNLGRLDDLTGDKEKALRLFKDACQIQSRLFEHDPQNLQIALDYSNTLTEIGHAANDRDAFVEALSIRQALVEYETNELWANCERKLANAYMNIANFDEQELSGKFSEQTLLDIKKGHLEAQRIRMMALGKLANNKDDELLATKIRRDLGKGYCSLKSLYETKLRYDSGLDDSGYKECVGQVVKSCEEAIHQFDLVLELQRNDLEVLDHFADCHMSIGFYLTGPFVEKMAHFETAREVLKSAIFSNPTIQRYRQSLKNVYLEWENCLRWIIENNDEVKYQAQMRLANVYVEMGTNDLTQKELYLDKAMVLLNQILEDNPDDDDAKSFLKRLK